MSTPAVAARQLRRVAVASAVGTTIEWYDYFIYSTATALVFGKLFFTTLSPASGTLAAFATLGSASSPARSAGSSGATSATGSGARRCWCCRCS